MARKSDEDTTETVGEFVALLVANAQRMRMELADDDRVLTLDEVKILQLSAKTLMEATTWREDTIRKRANAMDLGALKEKLKADPRFDALLSAIGDGGIQ